MEDDIFDDSYDLETTTCQQQQQWHARLEKSHVTAGYREGLAAGQESALQEGFNQGYCDVMMTSYTLAHLRGVLTAMLGVHLTGKEGVREFLKQQQQTMEDKPNMTEALSSQAGETHEIDGKATRDNGVYDSAMVEEIENMLQRLSEAEVTLKQPPISKASELKENRNVMMNPSDPDLPLQQLQTVVNLQQITSNAIQNDPECVGKDENTTSNQYKGDKETDSINDKANTNIPEVHTSVAFNVVKVTIQEAKRLVTKLGMEKVLEDLVF